MSSERFRICTASSECEAKQHLPDCPNNPEGAEPEVTRAQLEQAVLAYEDAVMQSLRHAPNHWHEYRDPFELSPAIRSARLVARSLAARSPSRTESAHG